MEIVFHDSTLDGLATVARLAQANGVHAQALRQRGRATRFQLVHPMPASYDYPWPVASIAAHDRVIATLLALDPHATVRTARAIYEGLHDFESQLKARLTQSVR